VSGYVASARVRAAGPRFAGAAGVAAAGEWRRHLRFATRSGQSGVAPAPAPAIVDLAEPARGTPPVVSRIRDRLAGFSARWAQLTWYLFSPESWR
jgi:hypothetical protein